MSSAPYRPIPVTFKRAGEPWYERELTTFPRLLSHLEVRQATPEEQNRAVRAWLEDHTPGWMLTIALQRRGYIPT